MTGLKASCRRETGTNMMNQMEMTLHTIGKSFLKLIHGIVLGCTHKVMEAIGEVKKRDQESKGKEWPFLFVTLVSLGSYCIEWV